MPANQDDTYPTHDAAYGKGGCVQVATIALRDAIPTERRTKGMLVAVTDDGANSKVYVLASGLTNSDWEPLDTFQDINLDASDITSGVLSTARIPSLDASKITSGIIDAAHLPVFDGNGVPTTLDAAVITTGTLDAARIPNLDSSKITTGTLDAARVPGLDASKIVSGTLDSLRIDTSGLVINPPTADTFGFITKVFNFASSDTFTVDAAADYILIEAWGAGGGGGGGRGTGTNSFGDGGTGGSYFPILAAVSTLPTNTFNIVVGAGGSGGSPNIAGTDGGNTLINGVTVGKGGRGGWTGAIGNLPPYRIDTASAYNYFTSSNFLYFSDIDADVLSFLSAYYGPTDRSQMGYMQSLATFDRVEPVPMVSFLNGGQGGKGLVDNYIQTDLFNAFGGVSGFHSIRALPGKYTSTTVFTHGQDAVLFGCGGGGGGGNGGNGAIGGGGGGGGGNGDNSNGGNGGNGFVRITLYYNP